MKNKSNPELEARIAAPPADYRPALLYFTGKALADAVAALGMLAASVTAGEWIPKASRRVRAALNKVSKETRGLAKAAHNSLDNFGKPKIGYGLGAGFHAAHSMDYGQFENAQKVNFGALRDEAGSLAGSDTYLALSVTRKYATDFASIADDCARLDRSRPKPVVTYLQASPTVTRTLEGVGFTGAAGAEIALCPHHYERREVTLYDRAGKPRQEIVPVMILDWPQGTLHGTSRFSQHDNQCEACGHGISNSYNWVPLVVTSNEDYEQAPKSLWVGRDCARTLFGIKVDGEVSIEGVAA